MRHQEASRVVRVPLERVETFLCDVERWPSFLGGVASAERLGHERYRFCVRDGRDCRDVVVAVRHQPATHAFTWKALEGPSYRGCLTLHAVDGRHTRLHLELGGHPGTFAGGFAEMIMPRMDRASHNLEDLEQQLMSALSV